jgi:hypothetical protein
MIRRSRWRRRCFPQQSAPRFTQPSLPDLAKLKRYGEKTGIASTQILDFDCLDAIIKCFVFHPRRTRRVAVQLALEKESTSRATNATPPLVQVSTSPAKHPSHQKASTNSLEFQTAVFCTLPHDFLGLVVRVTQDPGTQGSLHPLNSTRQGTQR